jgi:hypothetical protein
MIIIDLVFALAIDLSFPLSLSVAAADDICVLHFSILFFDLCLRPTQKKQIKFSGPCLTPAPPNKQTKRNKVIAVRARCH